MLGFGERGCGVEGGEAAGDLGLGIMGVCGHFGDHREMRWKKGDFIGETKGAVLSGEISVERAQRKDTEGCGDWGREDPESENH